MTCACNSSGSMHVLKINLNAKQEELRDEGISQSQMVGEHAVIDLPEDIFSSTVMIGSRGFIGCWDDMCILLILQLNQETANSYILEF